MAKFLDRVGVVVNTTGTGTVTLGEAIVDSINGNYNTFAQAGAVNGDVVNYLITNGNAWELGTGTYSTTGPTLTRTLKASSTGALLNLVATSPIRLYSTVFASDFDSKANTVHTHLWGDITDKPLTFAPSAHTHSYGSLTDIPATFTPSVHTHAWADITGKPATFTPTAHTHAQSEITDLITTLAGKQANLGFTPVRAGGGPNQSSTSSANLGLDPGGGARVAINGSDYGRIWSGSFVGASISSPGYIRFPNGLLIQWGWQNNTGAADIDVYYPVTFNYCYSGFVTSNHPTGNDGGIALHAEAHTNRIYVRRRLGLNGGSWQAYNSSFYWMAIGS